MRKQTDRFRTLSKFILILLTNPTHIKACHVTYIKKCDREINKRTEYAGGHISKVQTMHYRIT